MPFDREPFSHLRLMATILLLDVDGVLKSLEGAPWSVAGSDWKAGVNDFLAWCRETFDVVLILSSWQAHIHKELETIGVFLPSLAWQQSKTEGLRGLCTPDNQVMWVEDGWAAADRERAEALGIMLIETRFNEPLSHTREKMKQAMACPAADQGLPATKSY